MKRDILDDSVAFVEDAEHRDALRHWRDAALSGCRRTHLPAGGRGRILLLSALAARSEGERNQDRCGKALHAYSGIQGS